MTNRRVPRCPEGAHVRPCPLCGERPYWKKPLYGELIEPPQLGCPDCKIWTAVPGGNRLIVIREWNKGVGYEPPPAPSPMRTRSPHYDKCYKPPEGDPVLSKDEVLLGLQDLIGDRESFIDPDEPDSIFAHDAQVLEDAIRMIMNPGDRFCPAKETVMHTAESEVIGPIYDCGACGGPLCRDQKYCPGCGTRPEYKGGNDPCVN